jgi:DNA-binding ferritin-like protein
MFQREEEGQVSNDEETDDENTDEEPEEEHIARPSINLIAEKLLQRGTTYEDLIQAYLSLVSFDEYDGDLQDDFIRKETAIFRKVKNIIREYRRSVELQ